MAIALLIDLGWNASVCFELSLTFEFYTLCTNAEVVGMSGSFVWRASWIT